MNSYYMPVSFHSGDDDDDDADDDADDDDDDDGTFVIQIAVGSTNVRVGSIIFGARDYHTSATSTAST